MMKESPEKRHPNPEDADTEGVTAALTRAARRAHLIAHRTGTGVVVMRDGEVVEIEPDPEMYEEVRSVKRRKSVLRSNFFEVER